MVFAMRCFEKIKPFMAQQLRLSQAYALCLSRDLMKHFPKLNQRVSSGQGTVEYAILVGVLVVIAILAIVVFRPKIQELWTAISDGITSL